MDEHSAAMPGRRGRAAVRLVVLLESVARQLDQAVPPPAGWLAALAAPLALLSSDAGEKFWRRRAAARY
jgi:hypothetical protein